MKCLICRAEAEYGDLCKSCWLGLKMFQRNTKLLGRAIAYLGPVKRKLKTKRQRRAAMHETSELKKLIESQRRDENDRNLRFEQAIEK